MTLSSERYVAIQAETLERIAASERTRSMVTAETFVATLASADGDIRTARLHERLRRRVSDLREGRPDAAADRLEEGGDGRLLPGCARFIRVEPEDAPGAARDSLLVLGDLVPADVGTHTQARISEQPVTALHGLHIPGEGPRAATEWLQREGFLPQRETRVCASGYPYYSLEGASASLACALALVGLACQKGLPATLVPSASLHRSGDEWHLGRVGMLAPKLEGLPPGCKLLLSALHEGDPALVGHGGWQEKVVFCETLDDVLHLVFPKLPLITDALRMPVDLPLVLGPVPPSLARFRWLVALLLGAIVAEIGLWQEFAPLSNWPNGERPSVFSAEGGGAVGAAVCCSILAGLGCWWWLGRLVARPLTTSRTFYGRSFLVCLVGSFAIWVVLVHTVVPSVPFETSRNVGFQIAKALLCTVLSCMLQLFPAIQILACLWFYVSTNRWLAARRLSKRWCPYPGHIPIWRTSAHASIGSGLIVTVVTHMQWRSWKDPNEPGFGDLARGTHMLAQICLFVAAIYVQWAAAREVETVHKRT